MRKRVTLLIRENNVLLILITLDNLMENVFEWNMPFILLCDSKLDCFDKFYETKLNQLIDW